jgi:nucleoside 2-deoxyribosyltransferase
MFIYFAAPLFSQAEREFNRHLTKELEDRGYSVFLPQRDGVEMLKPPFNQMNDDKLRVAIFQKDRDNILKADIFLFVLDGRVPDEGACVELGIAYSQKYLLSKEKLLVGLLTDDRAAFQWTKLNSMIHSALDTITDNTSDLLGTLETYRQATFK